MKKNATITISNLVPGEKVQLKKGDVLKVKTSAPSGICAMCGITANYLTILRKYGRPPLQPCFSVSTYHKGKCAICGYATSVTEARDFFYPNFELLQKLINKYATLRSKKSLPKTKKRNYTSK